MSGKGGDSGRRCDPERPLCCRPFYDLDRPGVLALSVEGNETRSVAVAVSSDVPKIRVFAYLLDTPFGLCSVFLSDHGIVALEWGSLPEQVAGYQSRHPDEDLRVPEDLDPFHASILSRLDQWLAGPPCDPESYDLPVVLRGAPFQQEVWRHVMGIKPGRVKSYGQIARDLGRPNAARAIGQALAANELGVLVPCHRVVSDRGHSRGFRWGQDLRSRLLLSEAKESVAALREKILDFFNGDESRCDAWFGESNPMLGDQSPLDMVALGRIDRLEKFVDQRLRES